MDGVLTADASLTRIEEDVRRFWRRHEAPQSIQAARRGAPVLVLLQQPLDVAAQSWNDQVRLMATADLYARYHTMRGQAAYCHSGWSCHGLALEQIVEEWAVPRPRDMADFAVACREMATQNRLGVESQFERLGFWFAPPPAFVSMEPEAIGMVWSALRRLWEAGHLRQERRVVPFCPRCQTPLSDMEAASHQTRAERQSIWLRLPWDGEPKADFLVPVAEPWMLLGMVALAAHPKASYALVEVSGGPGTAEQGGQPPARLILAEAALGRVLAGEYRLVRRLKARALRGAGYSPPFTFLPAGKGIHQVLLDESVPVEDGTGLLAVTPAYDGRSLAMAGAHGLPMPELLDDWGRLDQTIRPWRGLSPLGAEAVIVDNLRERGLVHEEQQEMQVKALCPHCETPLLTLARNVWLAETASGPWIVGRNRVWGVPLPVWACTACGEELCLAGLDDLAHRTGLDAGTIDPHRPSVDHLTFPCAACGGTMRRVPPVLDPAFETAILSVLTAPQPRATDAAVTLPLQRLAIGLGDKDLGWLGDLTELAAQLQGALAWERAVTVPQGESAPGSPEPLWEYKPSQPSDALHWATHARTTPDQAEQDFVRPLWQWLVSVAGQEEAEAGPGAAAGRSAQEAGARSILERWQLARLCQAAATVTGALDAGEPHRAAAELAALLADAREWRARCQPGGSLFRDKETGHQALQVLSRLLAPFLPHLAEAIHRRLGARTTQSLHLAEWPVPPAAWEDRELLVQMDQVKHLVDLAGHARAHAGIETAGPETERLLDQARVVSLTGDDEQVARLAPFQGLLAELMGVFQVSLGADPALQIEWRPSLNPARVVEREVPPTEIKDVLDRLDPEQGSALAAQVREGLSIRLDVAGRAITLLPDEVHLSALAPPGWAAAAGEDLMVLLAVG